MANAGTAYVKIVPDLSEFGARMTQHLDLDDPLAKAIVDAPPTELRISARVGEKVFILHHWTVTSVDGARRLQTSWVDADEYLKV